MIERASERPNAVEPPPFPHDDAFGAAAGGRRVTGLVVLMWVAAGVAWVGLFALPHGRLAHQLDLYLCHQAPRSGACAVRAFTEQSSWMLPALVDFVGWSLAGVLLVVAGRRVLFLVPAVACVLLPPILGSDLAARFGGRFANVFAWQPNWVRYGAYGPPPWLAHPWLGAAAGCLLVLAPALVLLLAGPRRHARPFGPRRIAWLVIVCGLAAFAAWGFAPMNLLHVGDTSSAVAIVAVAAGLGLSSGWRRVAVVVLPVQLCGLAALWAYALAFGGFSPSFLSGLEQLLPWVAFSLLVAVQPPAMRGGSAARPRTAPEEEQLLTD